MSIAHYWSILVIGFVIFTPFVVAGEVTQDDMVNSTQDQPEEFRKSMRTRLGLDAPVYTISLEAKNVSEYRITDENRVKLVLRQPQNDLETVVWHSHSLSEAHDFIQLVKKGAVRSATVRNGRILEILLKDNALQ